MPVIVLGPRNKAPEGIQVVMTVSKSNGWMKGLSPFVLGPVDLYDGYRSKNVENAWQYSKVYPKYADENGPTEAYFEWANMGWSSTRAFRYPMGKGAKPLYSFWDGEKLGYVAARKKIYAPLYARCVEQTEAYKTLKELYEKNGVICLWDYDAYLHRDLGMSYKDVVNCETRKMGHAFVLAMMLENERAWELK